MEVVERQVERALRGLDADQVAGLLVAYEPVWAIGTGTHREPRAGPGGPRLHPQARLGLARSAGGGGAAHPLRRQRQAGQHRARSWPTEDVDGALVGGALRWRQFSFLKIVHFPPDVGR